MTKTVAALIALLLVATGSVAFAHMWGDGSEWGGGPMWGGGYGHMWEGGPGYTKGVDKKFLDETADLRKQMHEKRFELSEAVRNGETEKAESLGKELDTLREKIGRKGGPVKGGKGFARGGYCAGPYGW